MLSIARRHDLWASNVRQTGRSEPWCHIFYHAQRMEKVGSEIAHRQVPARPNFAAGSYLHANLAWHLGTMYRVPGMCVFEARSLNSISHTWNKTSGELFTHSLAEFVLSAQARSSLRVVNRMPFRPFR